MDKLHAWIARLWEAPTAAGLWTLQAPLLAIDTPEARAAHHLAGEFYTYLNGLEHKLAAQRYSHFAAILETAAVTTIGFEDVFKGGSVERREVFAAGLAGVLEVMAAMQDVKAWETDTRAGDLRSAWHLYRMFWEISAQMQPDLPPAERARHLDQVFTPVVAPDTPDPARVALIIRLYQLLLALHLLALLSNE